LHQALHKAGLKYEDAGPDNREIDDRDNCLS
jgi:hypothetical protein